MAELDAHPQFPRGLNNKRVNNGTTASAEVAVLLSAAIRQIAAQEHHLPTILPSRMSAAIVITAGTDRDFFFKLKHYARDVFVQVLMDITGKDEQKTVTFTLTHGADVTTEVLDFRSLGADTTEQVPWRGILFAGVGGSDTGKAENDGATVTLNIDNPSSSTLEIWAIDVTQLHNPVLVQ